ncbi:hypothetical protein [Variovorax paradoxus]|uniref:hypothetical protein n=1 Tax=Variovorax paradoxus TaxID=34073 RepID=UPI001185B258|nr:hypothetical protein [Variovorax paradoxus]
MRKKMNLSISATRVSKKVHILEVDAKLFRANRGNVRAFTRSIVVFQTLHPQLKKLALRRLSVAAPT